MHASSFDLCGQFVSRYLGDAKTLRVADVGSFDINGTYQPLFTRDGWQYVGFDQTAGPNVDVVVGQSERWCLDHAHHENFDVVISGQVLEHVRRPWKWIVEVARLCRPGGLIWVCAPNTWGFHEFPIDCWRVWPDGLRALLEDAGCDVLECQAIGLDTFGICQKKANRATDKGLHFYEKRAAR